MSFSQKDFKKHLTENISVHKNLLKNSKKISDIIDLFSKKLKNGNTIFVCGNGGSASDSEHLSTEFLVRLKPHVNRKPYKIINLSMNNSYLTACSNDYSFTKVFSRSLEAMAQPGDLLWAISTSGNSKNIINVLKMSRKIKIKSIGFLGGNGGNAKDLCDYKIIIPSKNVARVQENHIFLGHIIFEEVEKILIKKKIV